MSNDTRFRWTRAKYKRAQHLNRLLPLLPFHCPDKPALVQRYHDLWDAHPQGSDPLEVPLRYRLPSDDIPF